MDTFEMLKEIRAEEQRVRTEVEEKLKGMPRTIERYCKFCGGTRDFRMLPFGFTGVKEGPDCAAYECNTCSDSALMEIK